MPLRVTIWSLGIICASQISAQAQEPQCKQDLFLPLGGVQEIRSRNISKIERRTVIALNSPISSPYYGSSTSEFLKSARADIINAMYLSAYVSLTGSEAAKGKARSILLNWSNTVTRDQFASADSPVNRADYAGLGLYVGWIGIGAAFSYNILHCGKALSSEEDEKIRSWLRRVSSAVLDGRKRWESSNYFGGQIANNHLSMHNLATFTLGAVLNDENLMTWAYDSPENSSNFVSLLSEAIYSGGETDRISAGANAQHPEDGEIYDRYRMKEGKGLHYSFVQLLMFGLLAEISSHYGKEPYAIVGPNGETLKEAFIYYGRFLAQSNCRPSRPEIANATTGSQTFYNGAKIEAIYWNWIIPIAGRLQTDPQVKPLIERIKANRCEPPVGEYMPVPFFATFYD